MIEYFTGERSWHEFYGFLYGLPRWGKFQAALMMDKEYAEHLRERRRKMQKEAEEAIEEDDDDDDRWKPSGLSPEGFTPELHALYDLDERIQSMSRIMIMMNSKAKPPDIQKRKRPVLAIDLLELEDERDDMKDLASKFGFKKSK